MLKFSSVQIRCPDLAGVISVWSYSACRGVQPGFACPGRESRGRFMRTGKDHVQVQAVNVPVSLGDVRMNRATSS